MFVFDQLKRSDRQLQLISLCILAGMFVLAAGLWYVQIVKAKRFEQNMQKQTFRSVRVPAVRGKILDRNGISLAENQPYYSIDAYLEELLAPFEHTNTILVDYKRRNPGLKQVQILSDVRKLKQQARFQIVSNLAAQTSTTLGAQILLKPEAFFYHLKEWTYVPFPILKGLKTNQPNQLAIYAERLASEPSIDLDVHPVRHYPNGSAAAHLLGYVQSQDWPEEDEDISFQYCLPYWKGKTGLERAFDADLRGSAGVKRVVVNNYSYRQREENTPAEPGSNLFLTIDLSIQKAAEKALSTAIANARGAVVVMDVRNGDILAMVSCPSYDPNIWTSPVSHEDYARLNDRQIKPMFNRATGAYLPGSIFKILTSIACLESGLDASEIYTTLGYYPLSATHRIKDTAAADDYNFEKAFYKSSNSYFCNYGRKAGTRKLLEVGRRFHLGEQTEIGMGPESAGYFPRPEDARDWIESDLAYASIGQKITVSPLQMASVIAVIANGGQMYWPRIVSHLKSIETGVEEQVNSQGRIRDTLQLNPRHLEIIRHAMLMDTEHPDASAYKAFYDKATRKHLSPLLSSAKFRVAGKTGTAQRREVGAKDDLVTWFASYGPYENPRYAVIVMVESGVSGGTTCGPVALKIYEALVKSEQAAAQKPSVLSQN